MMPSPAVGSIVPSPMNRATSVDVLQLIDVVVALDCDVPVPV
jgi:hypothetical protein